MKRLAAPVVLCLAALLLGAGRAAAAPGTPIWAGQCGVPTVAPVWGDYGWPALASIFGRPGIVVAAVVAASSRRAMRAAGAATVYFDLYLNKRVGTTTKPADPAGLADKAKTFFDFAVEADAAATTR